MADGRLDSGAGLSDLYRNRFHEGDLHNKRVMWSVFCEDFFQQYVGLDSTVLDLGAGNCEFINAIRAGRKLAVDLNPETKLLADPDVEVLLTSSTNVHQVEDSSVDTVFTSNFFEHLPSKSLLLETLSEARRVLTAEGRLVVLMPNLRYVGQRYWDYFDHYLPLTHLSLVEALELSAFKAERVIPRFLPFTVRDSKLPVRAELIRAYLRTPLVWRVMGKQMLVVARKA